MRMSVLDPGHADTVERVEESFPPPPRVTATELFLDARDHSLRDKPPAAEATTGYRPGRRGFAADFTYRFNAGTEVIGYPVLTVWASVEGHEDGDLHVHVEKLDARGRQLWHQAVTLGLPLARTWMPIARRRGG